MRLLLETHVLLWWIDDDPRISSRARELISGDNAVAVSVVSIWEIAIKASLGRLAVPRDLRTCLRRQLARNQFELLPVLFERRGDARSASAPSRSLRSLADRAKPCGRAGVGQP